MIVIEVPGDFVASCVEGRDAGVAEWVATVPSVVRELCALWFVEPDDDPVVCGGSAVVIPVRRGPERYMLKVDSQVDNSKQQASALARWNGHGAVGLVAAMPDVGGLLLERLDWRRSLRDVEVFAAAQIAGRLLRRLAVSPPPGLPQLVDVANVLVESFPTRQRRLGDPLPPRWVDAATALAADLATCTAEWLVHADLHNENVLAGRREPWLAIDPRVVVGDPEYAVAELLWTRVDELPSGSGVERLLAVVVEAAELDADRAHDWALVRCVDYWLWGLERGLTADPISCERVLEAIT